MDRDRARDCLSRLRTNFGRLSNTAEHASFAAIHSVYMRRFGVALLSDISNEIRFLYVPDRCAVGG